MSRDFEKLLAIHCAPAIFGVKPSNLVNVSLIECPNIKEDIEKLNKDNPRVRFVILKEENNHILLLVYKLRELNKQLFLDKDNYEFLLSYGYPKTNDIDEFIKFLSLRIKMNSFPHEIGVFLGYDLDDIKDYISGTKRCLHIGYWKVYSNKDEKIKRFNKFNRCRDAALSLYKKGYDFERVIL